MKTSIIPMLFVIGSLLICLSACSQPSPSRPAQLTRVSYTSTLEDDAKDYFLYLPRDYGVDPDKKWPVLMFLHGDSERGNGREDLDYLLVFGPLYEAWIQKKEIPFLIIAPQLPMFGRDTMNIPFIAGRTRDRIPVRLEVGVPDRRPNFPVDFPMQGALATSDFQGQSGIPPQGWDLCEADLLTILDQTLAGFNADPDRVYLSGISYGGFGVWYMASKHPDRFAAINPIVGWGHPDLMEPIAAHQLPVWVVAGGRDQAVKVQYFYPGLNRLEALGHQEVRFTIHGDMGHDAWKRVYGGDDVYNWMLGFSRKSD